MRVHGRPWWATPTFALTFQHQLSWVGGPVVHPEAAMSILVSLLVGAVLLVLFLLYK
jgi:hypothetical protein